MESQSHRVAAYAPLPVRLAVAAAFVYTGWKKLVDLDAAIASFEFLGIWLPSVTAPLVAVAEFFGGIGLAVGVLPRVSSGVLALVMVVATWAVVDMGRPFIPNVAFSLVLLGAVLTILLGGTGRGTIPQALHRPWLDVESAIGRRFARH